MSQGAEPVRLFFRPELAEQVRHSGRPEQGGGAEGQATDGPELLLELAGYGGVEGQVAGIVGARSELVDQEAAARFDKEFDAQDADDVESIEDGAGDLASMTGYDFGHGGGGYGDVQNMIAVTILDDSVVDKRPVQS